MKLSTLFVRPPVTARHVKRTYVTSPDDEPGKPTRAVIETALDVVRHTLDIDLSAISRRITTGPKWTEFWPGEHYKLLAGFVSWLKPKTVVEVGTFTGLSSLALKHYLPKDSKVVTFDLIPWQNIPDTVLTEDDFRDGRLVQILADLADPATFQKHAGLLSESTLIFADGPKDGKFEPAFGALLSALPRAQPAWVLWDDIRDLHMLQYWRDIARPKLDLSSFGHWTGTGLVWWEGPRQA